MNSTEEKVFDILEEAGLNWTIVKEQLYRRELKRESTPISGGIPVELEEFNATKSYALFRSDNGHQLETADKSYTYFQNQELAEILIEACDAVNLDVSSGGSFSGGGKVFLQAELPETFIGKSIVKRRITCANAHDGCNSREIGRICNAR